MKNVIDKIYSERKYKYTILAIYFLLFFKAFFIFNPSFDYLFYHLPSGLTFFNKTTYVLSNLNLDLHHAHPPLAHLVQGFLAGFISLSMGNGVNFVGFIIFLGLVRWLKGSKFNYLFLCLAFLSVPIFIAQLWSGFIDAFSNIWLVLALISLLDLNKNGPSVKNQIIFSISVIAAVLSKYQMWIIVGVLCLFFTFELLKKTNWAIKSFVKIIVLAILVLYWPARNTLLYKNPTFPFMIKGIPFNSSNSANSVNPLQFQKGQLYEGFQDLPRPLLFVMSAFEISRLFPLRDGDQHMQWTYEQWVAGATKNPNFRMGGWSFITVSLLSLAIFQLIRKRKLKLTQILPFLTTIVCVSVIMQSYELRYFMFIPLFAAYLFVEYFDYFEINQKRIFFSILLLASFSVVSSRAVLPIKFHKVSDFQTTEIKQFWEKNSIGSRENPNCVNTLEVNMLYWSGPDFNTYWVKHCPN